jgi:transketolase
MTLDELKSLRKWSSLTPGSEVQLAVEAREALEAEGTPTRVVSMPCLEWFETQDEAYKQQVLPPSVRARVSVEAGVALGWRTYVGDAGESVSLERFGASADYKTLFQQFGLTAERVVAAARRCLRAPRQTKAGVEGAGRGETTGN